MHYFEKKHADAPFSLLGLVFCVALVVFYGATKRMLASPWDSGTFCVWCSVCVAAWFARRLALDAIGGLLALVGDAVSMRFSCPLCFDRNWKWRAISLHSCRHRACRACFATMIAQYSKDRSKFPLRCFCLQCFHELERRDVQPFLSADALLRFDRYTVAAKHSTVECPLCQLFMVADAPETNKTGFPCAQPDALHRIVCPKCDGAFCCECLVKFHDGQTCEKYQRSRRAAQQGNGGREEMLALARKEGYCSCPGCGQMVEKTDGCNHLQHSCPARLGQTVHFCYCCGTQLCSSNPRVDLRGQTHFPGGVSKACVAKTETCIVQ